MTLLRNLKVWSRRAMECHNPLSLAIGLQCDLQRRNLLDVITSQPASITDTYLREIEDNDSFISEISTRMAQWSPYRFRAIDFMMLGKWGSIYFNPVTLYALIRAVRPKIMIETGGTPGKSTAFLLQAMEMNAEGHLYTIDLAPDPVNQSKLEHHDQWHELRPAEVGSNWVVPDHLRKRHTLLQGKSSDLMPPLLERLGRHVDLFYHDSDHSYENMTWEFRAVLPFIKSGGIIASDDVLANDSFFDFCTKENLRYAQIYSFGAARVP